MDLFIYGKTALVTNAVEGAGRGVALALARQGARVVVTGDRKRVLQELAEEIEAHGGPQPIVVVEDLIAERGPDRIAAAVIAEVGWVDILVNNDTGTRPLGVFASDEAWEEALTAHFTRHRQLTQRLLPCMMEHGWGRVVSITGKCDPEGMNGASCAKAAMHAWSRALAREVASHGVTVNCVQPEHGVDGVAEEVCYLASPLAVQVTGRVVQAADAAAALA